MNHWNLDVWCKLHIISPYRSLSSTNSTGREFRHFLMGFAGRNFRSAWSSRPKSHELIWLWIYMHWDSCEIPISLFPQKRQRKKWKKKKREKQCVISTCPYISTFLLAFVESPGSPAPFSASTIVLRAVLPRQVAITLTSLRTDESEYHIISIYEGYDSNSDVWQNRNRKEDVLIHWQVFADAGWFCYSKAMFWIVLKQHSV